jgi:carbon monoxide dehydrogenase subunit G
MRIEGTYQFNAPIERVFAALTNPDAVGAAIPGCRRIVQFGPPDEDSQIHGEARLTVGPDEASSVVTWTIEPQRTPPHLAIEAHDSRLAPSITVRGFVDLVGREGRTVAAYVWDVDGARIAETAEPPLAASAGAAYLQRIGEALANQLAAGQPRATVEDALPILRADSARGRITLLPSEPMQGPVMTRLRPMLNRGVWAVAGVVAGVALLAALAATIGLLRKRDASVT